MDTRLVARLLGSVRTVSPVLPASASEFDLNRSLASGGARAHVAARLADGTFRVFIDGKALKLALPAGVKAGDVLELRVAGNVDEPGLVPGMPSNPSGKGLSHAGQLVATLVNQPATAPPRQGHPVLAVPPNTPADLPEPLARAVERSGLFYESHQARWVNGDYPLARLLEEPQAAMGRHETAPAQQEAALVDAAPDPALVQRPVVSASQPPTDEEPGVPQHNQTRGSESKDMETRPELVARESLAFVRQQLDTLETRQLAWLGEIWPGQTMHWEIAEQPQSPSAEEPSREWTSRFEMSLPALGDIDAELALSGTRLRIRLNAQDVDTGAMMRAFSRELTDALAAAGVEPLSFEVKHRDPAL
jgi:hypothetical protein